MPFEVSSSEDVTRLETQLASEGKLNGAMASTALPVVRSGLDLFASETRTVRALTEPRLLYDGLTMLAAQQKAGKSWQSLQFAIAIAGGPSIAGLQILEHGPVLYGALEEPAARTANRLRKLAPSGGDWLKNITFFYELMPLMAGGAEQLTELIRQHKPRFAVLDTLTALVKAGKSNGDVFRTQYDEVTRLRKLGEDHRIAILLVHHTRKGAADGPIEAVAGTGGITAAVDTVWRLQRKPEWNATLEVTGREVEECSYALRFERGEPFGWCFAGDGAEAAMTAERRELVEILRDEGGLTPRQIAAELGKARGGVRMMLKRMVADGHLEKRGSKYFPSLSMSDRSDGERGYRERDAE
jgi:hypothetical protein